jgi:hypothetical protein
MTREFQIRLDFYQVCWASWMLELIENVDLTANSFCCNDIMRLWHIASFVNFTLVIYGNVNLNFVLSFELRLWFDRSVVLSLILIDMTRMQWHLDGHNLQLIHLCGLILLSFCFFLLLIGRLIANVSSN